MAVRPGCCAETGANARRLIDQRETMTCPGQTLAAERRLVGIAFLLAKILTVCRVNLRDRACCGWMAPVKVPIEAIEHLKLAMTVEPSLASEANKRIRGLQSNSCRPSQSTSALSRLENGVELSRKR